MRLHYRVEGPAGGTPVLLLHSLGATLELWDAQAAVWAADRQVIRFDLRGHGRSATPPGDYTLADLGQDAERVLDAAGVSQAFVCGISIGGLIAQWLAVHRPSRVRGLLVANSAARIGSAERWGERIATVRAHGLAAVADQVVPTWFTPGFRAAHPDVVARMRATVAAADPAGYAGCCAALRDADLRSAIGAIRVPTLVVAGRHDSSTTVADAEFIQRQIDGASVVTLDAAHLSNVECADAFTALAARLFAPSRGESMRRRVLGDAHVDRSLAGATPLNAEFQQFITRYVWGEVWTRPGLDERTRRVLVLGTMIALGRWEEFALHVRAAVQQGGFTVDDLKEVVLQQAAYCGVPAANHALKVIADVLAAAGYGSTR